VQQHIKYWAEIVQVDSSLDSFPSFEINFRWYDAWQAPTALPGGPTPVKSTSCNLEIAAVLFNAATLALQYGAQCHAQKTVAKYSMAQKYFLRAAGLYTAVHDRVKGVQDEVSMDMSSSALEMLKMLSLVRALRSSQQSALQSICIYSVGVAS